MDDDRTPSYTYIQAGIFEPQCATIGCHSSRANIAGLSFDDFEDTYMRMTGGNCDDGPGMGGFVTPGNPDGSALMFRLLGDNVATRMPPDRPMPQGDIDLISAWITDGAPCN